MAQTIPNLRVLDRSSATKELDLASELFHRINRIIPENQSVLTVPPSCKVRDAVVQMLEHGYSQVPVVENGEVLGVFSFRSFSREASFATLEEWTKQQCSPGDLPVDEFLEQFEFARVTDEMTQVFEAMDRDNFVLIGAPDRLVGVLTPMDFLRYLYRVASPFVMVSEIELAVRALIRIGRTPSPSANSTKLLGDARPNRRFVLRASPSKSNEVPAKISLLLMVFLRENPTHITVTRKRNGSPGPR